MDRDGVINVDHGYVSHPDNFQFIDGIFEVCRSARERGYALIVATNQSGVGRGLFSEADLQDLHQWLRNRFDAEGAPLDDVYWCGFHPQAGIGQWRQESPYRKPAPGMLLQAAIEHRLDLQASVSVGDRERDLLAGRAAGVGTNLLFQPAGAATEHQEPTVHASAVITRLQDVIGFLRPAKA